MLSLTRCGYSGKYSKAVMQCDWTGSTETVKRTNDTLKTPGSQIIFKQHTFVACSRESSGIVVGYHAIQPHLNQMVLDADFTLKATDLKELWRNIYMAVHAFIKSSVTIPIINKIRKACKVREDNIVDDTEFQDKCHYISGKKLEPRAPKIIDI
ncbi:Hypothetical predicted protein [Octopus vulgaris]|uniref:Uncharacterized protein n=1 Tax=Octopus vulgaris TaxID=6645 RepID=A0AA36FCE5_OCTVU|nr:Hypothetical predicted protein [Octopus vulgaris]